MQFLLPFALRFSLEISLSMTYITSILYSASPNAALVLEDGSVFHGFGLGYIGSNVGEVCFNTSLTGYQEIITDPSYAGQIINFTFPHIGNVGTNIDDNEKETPQTRGVLFKCAPTIASNWRSTEDLSAWLERHKVIGLWGIDTRALTKRIRDLGAPKACIVHVKQGEKIDTDWALKQAQEWQGLDGLDLAKDVTCDRTYRWAKPSWNKPLPEDYGHAHVVAIDYGAKNNILRSLVDQGFKVTVVPATMPAKDIIKLNPDGVFLSNGPGDPAATGVYALPIIRDLMKRDVPIFGICLGHQLLALALGAQTEKMHLGHRGGNHPVQNLITGEVEITSQNHGFMVKRDTLPKDVVETHVSLFDGTNEGLSSKTKPAFSVQYHPESSPGPHDSHYLFKQFKALIQNKNTQLISPPLRKAS